MAVPESIAMSESIPDANRLGARPDVNTNDQASFALLVEQYQGVLCNFIYRYVRNRQDAEDLTQDTFVKAFRNFDRYDSRYAFSSWLYTIARRTVYNHYRSARPSEPLEFDIVDDRARPDASAERSDQSESVWQAARTLKPEFQEALALKYLDDLSIEEIAKIMGKSKANVKIMLFRARNQLRKMKNV